MPIPQLCFSTPSQSLCTSSLPLFLLLPSITFTVLLYTPASLPSLSLYHFYCTPIYSCLSSFSFPLSLYSYILLPLFFSPFSPIYSCLSSSLTFTALLYTPPSLPSLPPTHSLLYTPASLPSLPHSYILLPLFLLSHQLTHSYILLSLFFSPHQLTFEERTSESSSLSSSSSSVTGSFGVGGGASNTLMRGSISCEQSSGRATYSCYSREGRRENITIFPQWDEIFEALLNMRQMKKNPLDQFVYQHLVGWCASYIVCVRWKLCKAAKRNAVAGLCYCWSSIQGKAKIVGVIYCLAHTKNRNKVVALVV